MPKKPIVSIMIAFLIVGFVASILAGCSSGTGNSIGGGAPTRDWTILVYMCADNNLPLNAITDIQEMETVGSTEQVAVAVQLDLPQLGTDESDYSGCNRFFIKRNPGAPDTGSEGKLPKIYSPLVQEMGNVNMGNADALTDFVRWGVTNYPAKKYDLVIWDHGDSWKSKIAKLKKSKGVCYDETSNDEYLGVNEIKYALDKAARENAARVDVITFVACSVGNIETAYGLKGNASCIVYSQATMPGVDFDWQELLGRINNKPTMSALAMGAVQVEVYNHGLINDKTYGKFYTLSAIDTSQLNNLAQVYKTFSDRLEGNMDDVNNRNAIIAAANAARPFLSTETDPTTGVTTTSGDTSLRDLGDFMDQINNSGALTDNQLKTDAQAVKAALANAIVAKCQSAAYPYATGMSIWIPTRAEFNTYKTLYEIMDFCQATKWNFTLDTLTFFMQ